jgi:hypothetical protein
MTDYIQFLTSVCFTMVTGVVIVGCFGSMIFLALMFWSMIQDELM